ncbi:hypothetical protein C2S51_021834 [Perilla frutescens var. frutescens]|nr:hypothetical protein C2S51_021834 [Perilla frutescens var. frutescens]
MGSYNAVASLLEDLEQHLSLFNRNFHPFIKKKIEILYNAVSLMDLLLRDSSGLSYFIDQAKEKMVTSLARKAGHHVDFLAVKYMNCSLNWEMDSESDWKVEIIEEDPTLTQITQEVIFINQELEKIRDSSSSGKLYSFQFQSYIHLSICVD